MGHAICLAFAAMAVFLSLFMRIYLAAENKRRDEKYGKVPESVMGTNGIETSAVRDDPVLRAKFGLEGMSEEEIELLGDKSPFFRYVATRLCFLFATSTDRPYLDCDIATTCEKLAQSRGTRAPLCNDMRSIGSGVILSCCFYIPFVMILIVSALLSWMILSRRIHSSSRAIKLHHSAKKGAGVSLS